MTALFSSQQQNAVCGNCLYENYAQKKKFTFWGSIRLCVQT